MPIVPRIVLVIVVTAAAVLGYRYYDQMRGAEWEVSPQQIASTGVFLEAGYYQIDIRTRAGKAMEMLRLRQSRGMMS